MKKNLLLIVALLGSFLLKAQSDEKQQALGLVTKNAVEIGLTNNELANLVVSDTYFDNIGGARMVYLQQSYKSIAVYNQIIVLAFKNDKLVSKSGNFISSLDKKINNSTAIPAVTAAMAVQSALSDRKLPASEFPVPLNQTATKVEFGTLGISEQPITAQLTWVPILPTNKVRLAWQVYIIPLSTPDYWMIRVDASNNNILGMDNYTVYCNWDKPSGPMNFNQSCEKNHEHNYKFDFNRSNSSVAGTVLSNSPAIVGSASYRVIPFPAESPNHPGGAHALVNNPWVSATGNATTIRWHNDGVTDYTITRGNNVWAQEDRNNNNGTGTPATSTTSPDPLTFNFTPNFTVVPTQTTPVQNQQFNTTNLFYWNNIVHDLTYQYGFDEVSGNFQETNLGRGGQGSDAVNADAQDGGGTNNANFSTPADGGNPRMQMYLWNGSPQKDGDVDNGIIVHEYAHGISNRLTGGPSQAGCLSNAEQMGEGWSDYYGIMYTQDWANSTLTSGFDSPRGVGTYAVGQGANGTGIRSQKYSTNFAVNNKVYNNSISAESHNRGEIWCATLWDMTWNIINQVGSINPNIFNAAGTGGNSIALKLVTEGMKLQPCSPGFIDGRDGIIRADQLLYGGVHECAIREAFRRRGMGAFASQGSSSSVTDQLPDYSLGGASFLLTQNGTTQVPEGGFITYTNKVSTNACGSITNFTLTDTLPANVSWVSGGNYNAGTRVVSFAVNMNAAQTQDYSFTVQVNAGAYFPTVTLFEDNVSGATIPAANWTTNSTTSVNWVVSNARSHSSPSSYYSFNQDVQSDQKLFSTSDITLTATPPPLSFWHWYSAESTYDGGVLEISTNGGTTWTDLEPNFISGGYTGSMDATTLLAGRRAWTGSSNNNFIKTKVNLTPYANQNIKLRFRFTTDVGTNLEGWYVDDIAIKDQAVVEMRSNLFTQNGTKVGVSDSIALILPPNSCTNVAATIPPANTIACTGSNASFSVTAAGTNPTYQWQVSTNGGTSFTDITGATNASLDLTAVTAGMNNNQYQVVVSNACPSTITTAAAVLSVNEPASISAQPVSFTACSGAAASFSVTATGTSNSYQWQVSTDGGNTFADISGAVNQTLNLAAITTAMNNNQYHVVISSCSATGLISANVSLTVNSPAAFVSQPENITACESTNTSFTVLSSGSNVSYQWQVSTDGGITFTDIAAANTATLDLSAVTSAQNNFQYHVIISNGCTTGVTSANAILTVSNTASITAQPVNITACEGSAASFSAGASGTGYQWQVSTNSGASFTDIPGATNQVFDLTTVTAALDGSQYQLVVSTCGASPLISTAAVLTVVSPASITSQPSNSSVCEGANASFSGVATGTSVQYQWEVSVDGGISFSPIAAATNATLNLTGVTASMNNNFYRLVVRNSCTFNFTSTNAVLSVNAATAIVNNPADAIACAGSNVTFTASATGSGLSYQWQESTDGGATYSDLTGAVSASLTVNAITTAMNNNRYRLQVAGCNNVSTDEAELTVNALPIVVLTASPYLNLAAGQSTTLTATATPLSSSINWYVGGNLNTSLTGNTITVNSDELGIYYATATDANGCVNSSNSIAISDSLISTAFIYPNPNSGYFQVRYQGTDLNSNGRIITMYDAKGARVLSRQYVVQTAYEVMDVHAKKLSKGVYVLVLSDNSGKILGKGKVLIQ